MATTRGRCTNVDYCSLAAGKRDIDVPIGQEFVCPECARPLRAPPAQAASGGLNLLLAGGGVALLLIVGGIYAGYRLSRPAALPVSSAALPAAATPVATPPRLAAAMPAPVAAPAPAHAEQAVLLRLAGASTLAADAAPRLAAAYLASLGDTGVTTRPGRLAGETLVSGQRMGRPEVIEITARPGEAGSAAALAGPGTTADIAMTTRRLNAPEQDRPQVLGDPMDSYHPVALEGEAVIVNPRNAVSQLSMAQLRGVLAGSITAWPALGGTGRAIHLLGDADAAGLGDLLPGTPAVRHLVADAAAAVEADADALAVVPLSRAGRAKTLAIAALGAAPALPTPAAIASDSYPLARRLYLYAPTGSANPFVQRFAAFALSADGQAAIAQSGLVPLSVAPAAPAAPLTPKERYKRLVAGATRLAADLHFEANANKLDLHSGREVDRVWNFMMSDHTPSDHLILIGFADNQGAPDTNMALSLQRAKVVAGVFAKRGLPPGQVVAFGADLPIADNATEEGRLKNRRVEVFLRP